MKKIAVIPNPLRDENFVETKNIIKYLREFECEIYFESKYENLLRDTCNLYLKNSFFMQRNQIFSCADFLITLGGDGTIIEMAVDAAKYSVPIVGINVGTLGFLTQTEKGDYSIINDIFCDRYNIMECTMLDISVIDSNNNIIVSSLALNDLVIIGDNYKMITASTYVNGTKMGEYSADGIIVASAIGSTAYSLSAGGAVMHPELDAMIITPICPHTLKARSTVIPSDSIIEIHQEPPYRTETVVRADGKTLYKLKNLNEKIMVKKSKYTTLLIKQENTNFFDILRNKLSD